MPVDNDFVALARDGKLVEIEAALQRGQDPNATNVAGATGVELATSNGHSQIVTLLLQHGASPDRPATDGGYTSALISAATNGNPELVQLLVDSGADVNLVDGGNHQTALIWASAYGRSIEVVRILLASGADTSIRDVYGNTAIDLARHFGFAEIVSLLE